MKKVENRELVLNTNVFIGGRKYYMSGGVYYSYGPSGYIVVDAPVGGVVTTLPIGYRSVYLNGQLCYEYGGVYYRPTYRSGRRVYVITR